MSGKKMLTQKEKVMKLHMLICRVDSLASRLEQDCKDFHQVESMRIAKEMKELVTEYKNYLK